MSITSYTQIIHVSFEAYPYHFGGIGTIVYNLVKYAKDFKTILIAPFNKEIQETVHLENGSVIYYLPTKIKDKKIDFNSFIQQTQSLIHSLQIENPQIDFKIHIHDWKLIFLKNFNIPVTYLTFHKYEKLSAKEAKYIEKSIPFIIFVSKTLQKQIHYFKKNCFIIYNGIELNDNLVNTNAPKLNKSNYKVAFAGRFEKEKGFDFFIKCTKLKATEITFTCCGDGTLKKELPATCKNEGFLKDEKLQNFYNSIDLLIVPSRKDSFNLVIPEALNNHIPVIVSTIPSFRELYSNNSMISFFNFRFFSGKKMLKLIRKILQNSVIDKNFYNYDIKQTIKNLEELYAGNN